MARAAGISLAEQARAVRQRFPDGRAEIIGNRLRWTGELQPTDISRSYRVRIRYQLGRRPEVRVVGGLVGRLGEQLPHTWADGSLCLHEKGDWNPNMRLADTIVPWAAEWLAHYEIWLLDGEWAGGGEWPPRHASDSRTRRALTAVANSEQD